MSTRRDATPGIPATRTRARSMLTAVACSILIGTASTGAAALQGYVKIVANGVTITNGECTVAGLEEFAAVHEFSHNASIPIDPDTGQPSGQVRHGALQIVKPLGRSSPLLLKALDNQEDVSCELRIYQPTPTGGTQHVYTIQLTHALVIDVRPWKANVEDPEGISFSDSEAVSFLYLSLTATHEPTGIAYMMSTLGRTASP